MPPKPAGADLVQIREDDVLFGTYGNCGRSPPSGSDIEYVSILYNQIQAHRQVAMNRGGAKTGESRQSHLSPPISDRVEGVGVATKLGASLSR